MFRMTCPHYPNFSAEWCRCVADMKKPRMGSTIAYIPFGALIEAAQMRHYHEKLNFMSKAVRCGASQKKLPKDSTKAYSLG